MIEKSIRELQSSQEVAYQAEKKYFEIMAKLIEAKTQLALRKAKLIRDGKINGRSESQREAQLLQYAKKEYLEAKEIEKEMYLAMQEYHSSKRAWESWQAICLLQSGL